ncbi:MAG: DNA methyltransferase [Armatimonadota bacterium]|nr:DNA methyltransferase [bacterium]MDW8319834.1 DNA methyltransferase [Armatimonadota bacterium]
MSALPPELVHSVDSSAIVEQLERLGKLPADTDPAPLMQLAQHPNPKVRAAAAKNLAKLENPALLAFLVECAGKEPNTMARREFVSAVGRLRHPSAIPHLLHFLQDVDPKVVLQAIRGLLCFRQDADVLTRLQELRHHPNELIRKAIGSELDRSPASRQVSREHRYSPAWLHNVLVNADVLDVLRHVPDESIHLTFTSPPYYNARDYTIYRSYDEYLQFLVRVFTEVHRITKEGRFFVLNTSPVLVPRMSRQHSSTRYLIPFDIHPLITRVGFDFIDDIIWVKPEPSAKNRNGGFYQHRKPLGYKANSVVEYVIVYRKHTDKLIDWNMRQYDPETVEASKVLGDYEKTNVWRIAPSADPVHPAVFPVELATRIIELYSYRGDLVFDPFAGRGTVGIAALQTGRFYFLVEKDPQYAAYARQLLSEGNLFGGDSIRMLTLEEFASMRTESTGDKK